MIKITASLALCCLLGSTAQAESAGTLDGLLNQVKNFSAADKQASRERERAFAVDLQKQQVLLENSRQRMQRAEGQQQRLKAAFDANDIKLGEMEALIKQRSGQLGEVFGVAREKAGELRALLDDSLASADNPGRAAQLAFADSKRVPSLQELEALWYQFQLEMAESGKTSHFTTQVVAADGSKRSQAVVRFGLFAAATEDGQYLNWDVQQQTLNVLPTQPENAAPQIAAYLAGSSDVVQLDPTRGQLFALLERKPKLLERIHQGAEVGYVIIALGALGLMIALSQVVMMFINGTKVKAQLRRGIDDLRVNNALGRVLLAASATGLNAEQRELKVDQAILKEMPALERGQNSIKLLAAVAPLLGLLGTVVGMIATFQSITLFGTSDPKLMAGGISQALMTTVLGLVVTIPLLFSHSFLATRNRRLAQILQEKSLGLLADMQATGQTKGP